MNVTEVLLGKKRPMWPNRMVFREVRPLALVNRVKEGGEERYAGVSSCTQELQALFSCLRKWEFDDFQCGKERRSYDVCIEAGKRIQDAYFMARKTGSVGSLNLSSVAGTSSGARATTTGNDDAAALTPTEQRIVNSNKDRPTARQMNELLKQWPQPDVGARYHARLPHQSYADDLFQLKDKKKKKS